MEHSRIFYFYNDGEELVYLSSADWMGRNLDRRVEVLFPVEDNEIVSRLREILKVYLKDTEKGKILDEDGNYTRIDRRGKEKLNCQDYFYRQAVMKAQEIELKKTEQDCGQSPFFE